MNKFLLLFLTTLSFCSCSEENTPANISKKYVENMAHGNIDKAISYTTESSAKLLEFTKKFPVAINTKYQFELIEDSIENDMAWVSYKSIQGEIDTLSLIKENDGWKISLGD